MSWVTWWWQLYAESATDRNTIERRVVEHDNAVCVESEPGMHNIQMQR